MSNEDGIDIGTIHILMYLDDDGRPIVKTEVTGDHFPLIAQLGALELARDSLLRPEGDDE